MARTHTILLLALGTTIGCRSGATDPGVIYVEPDPDWQLMVTLESPAVDAGKTLSYGLVLLSAQGDTVVLEGGIESNLEPSLAWTSSTLTPIVAGTQTITGTAEYEGEIFEGSAKLEVRPGSLYDLDLDLDDLQVKAGQLLTYTLVATDIYGNLLDTQAADVEVDSAKVDLLFDGSAGELFTTTPGLYTVTASLEDATDSETWAVTWGDPAAVNLTLSDTELELFDTTAAIIEIIDEYGNEVDAPWTLSVDGPGLTSIAYSYITFWEEGTYTVRVDVDGTVLYDEVGPLLIDSSGPTVVIDDPEHGSWDEDYAGSVSGTVYDDHSGVVSLDVNGEVVTVASDGSFSHPVDYEFGLNILETTSVDGDGNVSNDVRTVLNGDFLPYGEPLEDGIVVRIHEGDGGFGDIESLGESLISSTDLDALIPSPVFSDSSESCIDLIFTEICITWYSVSLYVTNPYIGGTDLDLDCVAAGYIDTEFAVLDPSLDWSASGKVIGISYSGSGDISADSISVGMHLTPSVTSNVLSVAVSDVDVDSSNFDFDWDSWIYDVMDFFGLGLDSLIQGYMEDAIEDAVQDEVPALLEDALQDLEIVYDLELGERAYTIDALPSSVSVDDTGLTLGMQTEMTVDTWVHEDIGLGSLYGEYDIPTWSGTPGTAMAAGLDFINQALYVMWGGGLLDMNLDGAEFGLDVGELAILLGETEDLSIVTDAWLPPVVVPGTGAGLLDMQLGDLLLTIYSGEQVEENAIIQVWVTVIADLEMDSDGSYLAASLGGMDIYFDVVVPDARSQGAASTEALLEAIVPMLLPSLTDALGEIPIPDIDGFGIENITIDLVGADDGYLQIGGDLALD